MQIKGKPELVLPPVQEKKLADLVASSSDDEHEAKQAPEIILEQEEAAAAPEGVKTRTLAVIPPGEPHQTQTDAGPAQLPQDTAAAPQGLTMAGEAAQQLQLPTLSALAALSADAELEVPAIPSSEHGAVLEASLGCDSIPPTEELCSEDGGEEVDGGGQAEANPAAVTGEFFEPVMGDENGEKDSMGVAHGGMGAGGFDAPNGAFAATGGEIAAMQGGVVSMEEEDCLVSDDDDSMLSSELEDAEEEEVGAAGRGWQQFSELELCDEGGEQQVVVDAVLHSEGGSTLKKRRLTVEDGAAAMAEHKKSGGVGSLQSPPADGSKLVRELTISEEAVSLTRGRLSLESEFFWSLARDGLGVALPLKAPLAVELLVRGKKFSTSLSASACADGLGGDLGRWKEVAEVLSVSVGDEISLRPLGLRQWGAKKNKKMVHCLEIRRTGGPQHFRELQREAPAAGASDSPSLPAAEQSATFDFEVVRERYSGFLYLQEAGLKLLLAAIDEEHPIPDGHFVRMKISLDSGDIFTTNLRQGHNAVGGGEMLGFSREMKKGLGKPEKGDVFRFTHLDSRPTGGALSKKEPLHFFKLQLLKESNSFSTAATAPPAAAPQITSPSPPRASAMLHFAKDIESALSHISTQAQQHTATRALHPSSSLPSAAAFQRWSLIADPLSVQQKQISQVRSKGREVPRVFIDASAQPLVSADFTYSAASLWCGSAVPIGVDEKTLRWLSSQYGVELPPSLIEALQGRAAFALLIAGPSLLATGQKEGAEGVGRFGVIALEDIPAEAWILSYCGEYITEEEYGRRNTPPPGFTFALQPDAFCAPRFSARTQEQQAQCSAGAAAPKGELYVTLPGSNIDARFYGNASRFIAAAEATSVPNCAAVELDLPWSPTGVFIHALRAIQKGEELTL